MGLRVHGMGGLVGWEYGDCSGGGWVRYMKAGGVLKGLGVQFTVHKTDWL